MTPQELVAEARAAGKNARHNLRWMEKHPDRIDQSKSAEMEAYLRRMIRFSKEEMKSAKVAAQAQGGLRSRLKNLITLIVSQSAGSVKEHIQ